MVLGGLVVVVVVLVVVAGSGSSIRNIIVNTTINVVAAMLTEKCRLWVVCIKKTMLFWRRQAQSI